MRLDIIPQVFYDLIARVIPGFVVIATWCLVLVGPETAISFIISPKNQDAFSFGAFILITLISYLGGFALGELWTLTGGKSKKKNSAKNTKAHFATSINDFNIIRKILGAQKIKLDEEDMPSTHSMHDHIRQIAPAEGYRLLKLRAEVRFGERLYIGLLLIPIINLLFWQKNAGLSFDRIMFEAAVLIILFTFWRKSRRHEGYYTQGVCRSWLLANFPVESKPQRKSKKLK